MPSVSPLRVASCEFTVLQMQLLVRTEGVDKMDPSELDKFATLHSTGKLVKPEDCGGVIANLSVNATSDLSGKYLSWDDEGLKQYRE